MTVKLAKFFSNNTLGNGMIGATISSPPALPTPIATINLHNHYFQQQQQQQQQQRQYNPYLRAETMTRAVLPDEEELDNMSIYSANTSNIMSARNHPCNNSQRPLLADRKPQILVSTANQAKLKLSKPNKQKPTVLPQVQPIKSYLPAYVPQQKRDSAKGLHGFNDFDILSQQYNQQLLHSPHIGYPYGSPPSPTANSSDFVFDTALANENKTSIPIYGNICNFNAATTIQSNCCNNKTALDARFEDDFCSNGAGNSGPFIFGVPYEQQINPNSSVGTGIPPGGRGFSDSTDTVVIPGTENTSLQRHTKSMTQSSSDTSSSSRDDSNKGVKKFLLRKRKSKKTKKDKETERTDNQPEKLSRQPTIKCVVVGDGAVGKTNLILSYLENRFNPEHVPTASDIYNADVMVNDSPVHVTLCDTAGQDTLDPLRELCYPDSDVFLLCFSVAKPETFHAIKTKWAPKFTKSKAALVLVGTQSDLRTNASVLRKLQTNGEKPVSYADAWDLATSIGAKYIETSSVTQEKVKEVFDTAIWEGLLPSALPPTPSFWKKLFCLA